MSNQVNYILGIDAGTSLIKSVVFDLEGREVGKASQPIDIESPHPGWMQQDMHSVWAATCVTIRAAISAAGVNPSEIGVVAPTGQGDGAWLLDKAQEPIGPAMLWNDSRAADIIAEWEASGLLSQLFTASGTTLWPGSTAPLLQWLRTHEPSSYNQIETILYCKDWVRFKLTDVLGTDETDSSIPFMRMASRLYDSDQMSLLGLVEVEGKLATIHQSHEVIGSVTREAAAATGLHVGTPVIAGMLDVAASAVGVGAIDAGQSFTLIGTTALNAIVLDQPILEPADIGATVCHGLPQRWMRVLGAMSGTPSLDWYIAEIGQAGVTDNNGDPFAQLEADISAIPVGSGGLIFHPYLSGERAPFLDATARAGFFGISAETTHSHLARAVYEGISLSIRDCFERIGGGVTQIRLAGGGAKSKAWRQVLADVTNCTMEIPAGSELGALGAAMTGGVGIGLFDSYQSAVDRCVQIENTYHPNPANVAKYNEIYQLYRLLIEQMTPFWRERQAMLGRWEGGR